nr:immunoglobulin heavy chain junction region [Mus musculus]
CARSDGSSYGAWFAYW